MAEAVTREEFELPESISGLTDESFWSLADLGRVKSRVESRIKHKFEPPLYAKTGYSNDNRPTEAVEREIPVGEKTFRIKVRPTTKTPSYSGIIEGFGNFLDFLKEQREVEEAYRRGVRTFDGEPFVDLDVLEGKLERDLKEILEGKEGVEHTNQGILGPDGQLIKTGEGEAPRILVISFDIDYGELTPGNANVYWDALNFLARWNERASVFKEEVKEDSLRVLGGKPEKPRAVRYPFDGVAFYHQLEPRTRTSYADVFEKFTKPVGKVVRKGAAIGDFPKVKLYFDEGGEALLREKALVDDGFIADYKPRKEQDGRIFVRLQGVADRLSRYRKGKPYLEQNFFVRRV